MRVTIQIKGKPAPKERPRKGKYGFYTPKKTSDYEKFVKEIARKHFPRPIEGAISCDMVAAFAVPKSYSKKDREAALAGVTRPTKRPDIDNIFKAAIDALNGIAYIDDCQIVESRLQKIWGTEDSVTITIYSTAIDGAQSITTPFDFS